MEERASQREGRVPEGRGEHLQPKGRRDALHVNSSGCVSGREFLSAAVCLCKGSVARGLEKRKKSHNATGRRDLPPCRYERICLVIVKMVMMVVVMIMVMMMMMMMMMVMMMRET
ncbi:hypothetical protein E2C01_046435 [Portunus trituberculatus]|uniref:Uncharacterized protein n=1 Tax=Portunus trituberculatus TaxID=210409 RepID=A0A5B7G7R1_PORTR|nr:hypothetical protein [Portunus trituberculatus]